MRDAQSASRPRRRNLLGREIAGVLLLKLIGLTILYLVFFSVPHAHRAGPPLIGPLSSQSH